MTPRPLVANVPDGKNMAVQLIIKSMDLRVDIRDDVHALIIQRAADEAKSAETVIIEALARALGVNIGGGIDPP